jgi:tetratricopeptide (TPR) repeat protein
VHACPRGPARLSGAPAWSWWRGRAQRAGSGRTTRRAGDRRDGGGERPGRRSLAAADDVSTSYLSLIHARKDAGDAPGARKDAEAWAAFLEGQAAAANTPEQRAVFDSHRLSAYMELQQPERAIPMLQASEKDLPDDYNPPSRLAVAFMAMKKPDEALAASTRALPKVTGPRRVQVLQRRSDIFAAKGDAAAAREALEQALASAEALPAGQRSEGQIKALKKKLETPPAGPSS